MTLHGVSSTTNGFFGSKGGRHLEPMVSNESGHTDRNCRSDSFDIPYSSGFHSNDWGKCKEHTGDQQKKNKMIAEYRAALEIYLAYGEDIKSDSVEIIKETICPKD